MTRDPETFTIRLRDTRQPGRPPAVVRLRRLLKAMGRSYGFRAVEIRYDQPKPNGGNENGPTRSIEP